MRNCISESIVVQKNKILCVRIEIAYRISHMNGVSNERENDKETSQKQKYCVYYEKGENTQTYTLKCTKGRRKESHQ